MRSTVAPSTLYSSFRVSGELFLLFASYDLTTRTFKSVKLFAHAILFEFDIREVLGDFSSGNLSKLPLLIRFSFHQIAGTERCSARRDSKVGTHVNRGEDYVVSEVAVSVQWLLLIVREYVYIVAIVTNNVLLRFAGGLDVIGIVHVIVGRPKSRYNL